jgi:hypothetical protein
VVRRLAPDSRPASKPTRPDHSSTEVMYFDFPGDGPASWNREFEGPVKSGSVTRQYAGFAKTFVHPFIAEVRDRTGGEPRYEFVLQYWFFYPYDDAGNVHQGDWEHLNVVVTPLVQGKTRSPG